VNLRAVVPLVTVTAVAAALGALRPSFAGYPEPRSPAVAAQPAQPAGSIQGIGGCAAAGCHNAPGLPGPPGTEYGTFVHDPHGRAFATLDSPKYRAILARLRGTAYTEELCLKCHATPTPDGSPLPRDLLSDGVGCESCHGPAEKWRTVHYQTAWKNRTDAEKAADGLYPLKDLGKRVEKCAECHVGTADKDVNHDLIAAGHPRLNFEFTAYHHLMPRHWREPHELTNAPSDWEARAWMAGQAATAKAAVDLTAARAKAAGQPTHPWPEFSEFGCYACHHDLQPGDSWRRSRRYEGLPAGSLPWGTWPLPAAELLAQVEPGRAAPPARPLVELMAKSYPPPARVAAEAQKIAEALYGRPNAPPLTAEQIRDALRKLAADADKPETVPDWESATQQYLAIAALYHALGDLSPADRTAARRDAVLGLRKPLRYPDGFDGPRNFTPKTFLDQLRGLQPLFRE
jgi:hypothetical protein